MANASQAFLDAVRKSMGAIRSAIGATAIDPALLTAAEKLRYEGYLFREEANTAILALSQQGVAIKEIWRRTGYSRLDPASLARRAFGHLSNPAKLARSLVALARRAIGERKSEWSRVVARAQGKGLPGMPARRRRWSGRRRRADKADPAVLARAPSARTLARLLTIGRERLTKSETLLVAAVEAGVQSRGRGATDHCRLPEHCWTQSPRRTRRLVSIAQRQSRRHLR